LGKLERILLESGLGAAEDLKRAAEESHGLGPFVRSLVGMDRGAAKEALGSFLSDRHLSANQIEFVNLIIDYLTEHGVFETRLLYQSRFTDISPQGPEGLFKPGQIDDLLAVLASVRKRAAG
jgi:type I restriction enzyme R subunit